MAQFKYKVMDSNGDTKEGIIDSDTQGEAVTTLRSRGLLDLYQRLTNSYHGRSW